MIQVIGLWDLPKLLLLDSSRSRLHRRATASGTYQRGPYLSHQALDPSIAERAEHKYVRWILGVRDREP